MADRLRKIEGRSFDVKLLPGSNGVFEVTVDGRLVYSKKQTGEHPDQDKLVAEIAAM